MGYLKSGVLIGLACIALLQVAFAQSTKDKSSGGKSCSDLGSVHFDLSDAQNIESLVYFRNVMGFTRNRESAGAASSLIKIDGELYVVTAKHLLTDAMGITPDVKPTEFDEALDYWMVLDNRGLYTDTLMLGLYVEGIFKPNDRMGEDFMVLSTGVSSEDWEENLLPLAAERPERGEKVYVIGCPYSMQDDCLQIMYEGEVSSSSSGRLSVRMSDMPDSLSGFSGAPIVNEAGELVAVLYGGGFGSTVSATPIPDWLSDAVGSGK